MEKFPGEISKAQPDECAGATLRALSNSWKRSLGLRGKPDREDAHIEMKYLKLIVALPFAVIATIALVWPVHRCPRVVKL